MSIEQITDFDGELDYYIDNDAVLVLNDLFGQIGINKYEKRPDDFYRNNGINVDKIKYLFQKTKYEEFSDYLICIAWEFRCTLKKSRKRDSKIELYLNNMLMLRFLRKYYSSSSINENSNPIKSRKRIFLTISNSTKQNFKTDDEGLVLMSKEYLEKSIPNACLELDANEFAKNHTTVYSDLNEIEFLKNQFIEKNRDDYKVIEDVELERRIKTLSNLTKSFGKSLKTKDIAEFIEILMFLGAFRKNKKLNPKQFNDFTSENYTIVFEYLLLSGILDLIFSEKGKKVKDLKSSGYDYIRSIINNIRKRRSKTIK